MKQEFLQHFAQDIFPVAYLRGKVQNVQEYVDPGTFLHILDSSTEFSEQSLKCLTHPQSPNFFELTLSPGPVPI